MNVFAEMRKLLYSKTNKRQEEFDWLYVILSSMMLRIDKFIPDGCCSNRIVKLAYPS